MSKQISYQRSRKDCSGAEKFILDVCNLLFYAACALLFCCLYSYSNYTVDEKATKGYKEGVSYYQLTIEDKLTGGNIAIASEMQTFATNPSLCPYESKVLSQTSIAEFRNEVLERYKEVCLAHIGLTAAFVIILGFVRKKAKEKILIKI